MHLYLIEHGEAVAEDLDPQRSLTEKGKSDIEKTAKFLEKISAKTDEIWYSSKLRSKQTAEIIKKRVRYNSVKEKNFLNPNDPIGEAVKALNRSDEDIIIIGHLPFLQKLLSYLLTGEEKKELVKFVNGSVLFLELGQFGWQMEWLVSPSVIK
ncbi:MAG: phosphohistidine phosphatase SixA [Candidatus Margulisbacteria bacterium]|nr:phosphohistidine phosphatase SixA [Candidatus Margulisiibacteriota bacterium]